MTRKPDVERRFTDAEVRLYRAARRFNDGDAQLVCDEMVVQHLPGIEEDVVIYERDGKRKVGNIRLLMGLQTGAASSTANFTEAVEPLDDCEEEKKLLAIYDRMCSGN